MTTGPWQTDHSTPAFDDWQAERFAAWVAAPCECAPCPGRGYDGHGMGHCAECCFGSGVEADIDCAVHGDATARSLAAWVAANPAPELTDWERRAHDRAFEVEPPEVDEDTQRGDMANAEAARVYGGRDVA